ncbi:insulin-induced gene 2 protein [Rhypophila decipiens]
MEPGPGQGPEQDTANNHDKSTTTTGPKIIRPIPRRPFSLALKSPTPPEDDSSAPGTPPLHQQPHQQKITAHDLRFLAIHNGGGGGSTSQNEKESLSASSSISRAASLMNLTSSTLFGIYSPESPNEPQSRRGGFDQQQGGGGYDDRFAGGGGDEPTTPWGTGAETPARRRPGLDEETYRLMKSRSSGVASSGLAYRAPANSLTSGAAGGVVRDSAREGSVAILSSLLVRGMLLFALGMGYGVLVTRLPTKARHHQHLVGQQHDSDASSSEFNWGYLTFWGCAGVALGCLLPWFDQVWEETFGKNIKSKGKQPKGTAAATKKEKRNGPLQDNNDEGYFPSPTPSPPRAQEQQEGGDGPQSAAAATRADTDWALVIRGIGAFVGIVFAIRRLPWTSTMQVSLTLAMVNPFLWYLVDRSKPGFLLSAAVGVFGSLSVMLLGVGGFAGGVLPAPFSSAGSSSSWGENLAGGSGGWGARNGTTAQQSPHHMANNRAFGLGGLEGWFASQENIEAGVWILSVLFCSCVCFGNIGRRLALNRSAAARGRWGGVR